MERAFYFLRKITDDFMNFESQRVFTFVGNLTRYYDFCVFHYVLSTTYTTYTREWNIPYDALFI